MKFVDLYFPWVIIDVCVCLFFWIFPVFDEEEEKEKQNEDFKRHLND